jgi:hypothetical protein
VINQIVPIFSGGGTKLSAHIGILDAIHTTGFSKFPRPITWKMNLHLNPGTALLRGFCGIIYTWNQRVWHHHQMNVVRHQAISPYLCSRFQGKL